MTATMQVWGRPLVPPEVIAEPQVLEEIEGQLNSSQEVIDHLYRQTDAAYTSLLEHAPTLDAHLSAFDARVGAIENTLPPDVQQLAAACRTGRVNLRETAGFCIY
jgi:hypothetical protein